MLLIICHYDDVACHWLYAQLKAINYPVVIVSAEMLPFLRKWEQHIAGDNHSVIMELYDKTFFDNNNIDLVINRVQYIPVEHWRSAGIAEKEYAAQEMSAFYTSWLYGLGARIYNPPKGLGLSGIYYSQTEWMVLALKAGFDINAQILSSSFTAGKSDINHDANLPLYSALIFDEAIFTQYNYPDILRAPALQLRQLAELPLFEYRFQVSEKGKVIFISANSFPDFSAYGKAFANSFCQPTPAIWS